MSESVIFLAVFGGIFVLRIVAATVFFPTDWPRTSTSLSPSSPSTGRRPPCARVDP